MRLFFFIITLVWTLPAPLVSQEINICGPRAFVVEKLAEEYGEQARALGLDNNNGMVEVFANIESGSWTITVTNARGMTCLVASGQAFEALLQLTTRPDSDT